VFPSVSYELLTVVSLCDYVFDDLVACFQYVSKVRGVLPTWTHSTVVVVSNVYTCVAANVLSLIVCCFQYYHNVETEWVRAHMTMLTWLDATEVIAFANSPTAVLENW
jgi:hypothetical protein